MREEEVRTLARARRAVMSLQEQVKEIEETIAEDYPEYEKKKAAVKLAQSSVQALETQLRMGIVNRWEVLGEKPDHPALGIREYVEPEYDQTEALKIAVDYRLYTC